MVAIHAGSFLKKEFYPMKGRNVLMIAAILTCFTFTSAQTLPSAKYPSLRLGVVLPSSSNAPTDQESINRLLSLYGSATGLDVSRFEAEYFDFSFGSGMPAQFRSQIPTITYAYFHFLYTSPASGHLRKFVEETKGWNWEDMFLHFKQDTYMDAKEVTTTDTIWVGKPTIRLYQTSSNSWMNAWSSSVDALSYSNAGGGLIICAAEPVAELVIESLSRNGDPGQNGQIVIEYVNARNPSNEGIAGWGTATVTYDSTDGLRQPGVIRWSPPSDWKWAICTNSSYAYKGRVFVIRLRTPGYSVFPQISSFKLRTVITVETTNYRTGQVISATSNSVTIGNRAYSRPSNYYKDMTIEIVSGQGAGQTRTITGSDSGANPKLYISPNWDTIPNNTSVYRITGPTVKVPGWDPVNDTNGDGYVDDAEYANRSNPNASARFKWEARVTKGTEQWSSSSALCFPNIWDTRYGQMLRDYYIPSWQSDNIKGYYNDDALKLMSYAELPVLAGGYIWEREGGPVGVDPTMNGDYLNAYVGLHQSFRQAGVEWVAANISAENMWMNSRNVQATNAFNLFLCEDMVWDTLGYCDNYGIMRRGWAIAGYAQAGITSLVMGQKNRNGGVIDDWGNTQAAWEYATMAQLAQYYLINIPDKTMFNFWSQAMTYGSGLTSTTQLPYLFWKAGAPVNMVYPPFNVIAVDIGVPANRIPGDYQPMHYIHVGSYTLVGNTTDSTLTNVPGTPNNTLQVVPTYTFYLWRSTDNVYGDIPTEAVLAREYTKGLVLYRARATCPSSSSGRIAYMAPENSITVQLPGGPYRRVNYEGTLGPPVNEISIRGFEGIVLVKEKPIEVTLNVSNTRPRPGERVEVTITVVNKGRELMRNHVVRQSIPTIPQGRLLYVPGTLRIGQIMLPDPRDRSLIEVTVPSLAPGEVVTVSFQAELSKQ